MASVINPDNGSLHILGTIDTISGITTDLNITSLSDVNLATPTLGEAALNVSGGAFIGGNLYVGGSIVAYGDVITLGSTGSTVVFSSDIASHLIPATDVIYDLGSPSQRWRDLYLDGSTIHLGDMTISKNPSTGRMAVNGEELSRKSDNDTMRQDFEAYKIAPGSTPSAGTLSGLSNVNAATATHGQTLIFNASTEKWIPGNAVTTSSDTGTSSGTSQSTYTTSRNNITHTTISLAPGETESTMTTGASSYALLSMTVSAASWVRIYGSPAAQLADSTRTQAIDPSPGSGVLAEAISTGPGIIKFSPANICWNDDDVISDNIYVSITNNTDTTTTVQLDMNVMIMAETITTTVSATPTLARNNITHTTAILAPNAIESYNLPGARTYALLELIISDAAWIRIYSSQAAQAADINRDRLMDPPNGSGVLAEAVSSGPGIIKFTPANICWNDDDVISDNIYVSITNNTGTDTTIQLDMNILIMEP